MRSPPTAALVLLTCLALAIAAFLWRMGQEQAPAIAPRPPTDRYEGSSGMGADGFGGWPAKPRAR